MVALSLADLHQNLISKKLCQHPLSSGEEKPCISFSDRSITKIVNKNDIAMLSAECFKPKYNQHEIDQY